jgi:hypothetical protein
MEGVAPVPGRRGVQSDQRRPVGRRDARKLVEALVMEGIHPAESGWIWLPEAEHIAA